MADWTEVFGRSLRPFTAMVVALWPSISLALSAAARVAAAATDTACDGVSWPGCSA
jgi:hypothetical protein